VRLSLRLEIETDGGFMSEWTKRLADAQKEKERQVREAESLLVQQREHAKQLFPAIWQRLFEQIRSDVAAYNQERGDQYLQFAGEPSGDCMVRRLRAPVASVAVRTEPPQIRYCRSSQKSTGGSASGYDGALTLKLRGETPFFVDDNGSREMLTVEEVSEYLLTPVCNPTS